jgi:hypothetical protein
MMFAALGAGEPGELVGAIVPVNLRHVGEGTETGAGGRGFLDFGRQQR